MLSLRSKERLHHWMEKHHLDLYYEQVPLILSMLKFCMNGMAQIVSGRKEALNPKRVGRVYQGRPVRMTPKKIDLFSGATEDQNPFYRPGRPPSKREVPPMMVALPGIYSMIQIFADRGLSLDFSHMFHVGQDIEFVRPLICDEEVISQSWVQKIIDKGKGEILVTETFNFGSQGDLISKATSSWYVRKPKPLQTDRKDEFRTELLWDPPEGRTLYLLDRALIHRNQMMKYAKISGDYNFIHISNILAKMMGLKGKILQGLCTLSFISKGIVNGILNGNPKRLKRINIRFVQPVNAGDLLETYGWKIYKEDAPWVSSWLPNPEENSSLYGFTTITQSGEKIVSRGLVKIEDKERRDERKVIRPGYTREGGTSLRAPSPQSPGNVPHRHPGN